MFIEISNNIPGAGIDLNDWNVSYEGCNCITNNNDYYCCLFNKTCSCSNYHKINAYKLNNNKSKLILNFDLFLTNNNNTAAAATAVSNILTTQLAQINECNLECNCDENKCLNRLVQNGCYLNLELFNCNELSKGKGVRACEFIECGSFCCEYMGEIISPIEAEKRFNERSKLNEKNFILVLREHYFNNDNLKVITCIDAKNYGNIGRFINHSCEPNLIIIPVRIDNLIPHAALFAIKDIKQGEELCYDYFNGLIDEKTSSSLNKCYCMTSKCRGYLPANKF